MSRIPNNNALDTISAAATAIASAENRAPQVTVQKRRWGSCFSLYWCFGYPRHSKRIGHAVLVPENSASGNNAPQVENPTQPPPIVLPFVAPPSSPASFLQSEPPSAMQSPAGVISFTSMSASMYSPSGPASIFAIGPYANETQLVSPPVFSTFTTEPSTAPFTPPPESVHLTTPSSPEVPFAQLLDPSLRSVEAAQKFPFANYEFQSYQLYPGSPVGHLISPSSGISGSGTSSPLPDSEFAAGGPHILQFRMGDPTKLFNLGGLSYRERGQGSGTLTPDAVKPTSRNFFLHRQLSDIGYQSKLDNGNQNDKNGDHRVSFDLTAIDVLRCVEQKSASSAKVVPELAENGTTVKREENSCDLKQNCECRVGKTSTDGPEKAPTDMEEAPHHQKHPSITLSSVKDFNFDNADGGDSHRPNIGSDWWTNGSVAGKEAEATKNWSFFPMIQPGLS